MSIRIMCHHHTIREEEKELIEGKIEKLRKIFDRILEVSVILDAGKKRALAEILVYGPQTNLRFKSEGDDMRTAFEEALNKAERGLQKNKEKKFGDKKKGRNNVTIRRFNPMDFSLEDMEPAPINTNSAENLTAELMEPKPMTLEEARLQLKTRDNGLVVFVNAESDQLNVLHRNRKKEVELIELSSQAEAEETIQEILH